MTQQPSLYWLFCNAKVAGAWRNFSPMNSFGCMVDMYPPYLSVCSMQVVTHTILYTLIRSGPIPSFSMLYTKMIGKPEDKANSLFEELTH